MSKLSGSSPTEAAAKQGVDEIHDLETKRNLSEIILARVHLRYADKMRKKSYHDAVEVLARAKSAFFKYTSIPIETRVLGLRIVFPNTATAGALNEYGQRSGRTYGYLYAAGFSGLNVPSTTA